MSCACVGQGARKDTGPCDVRMRVADLAAKELCSIPPFIASGNPRSIHGDSARTLRNNDAVVRLRKYLGRYATATPSVRQKIR